MPTTTDPPLREADLLRLIDARYSPKRPTSGYPQRYLIAHHVQPPRSSAARKHPRIADAIVLDRNSTFPPLPDDTPPDRWGRVGGPDYSRGYCAVHGFEVKVSRSDWLRELSDPTKAEAWARYCHHWWLVAPRTIVHPDELPPGWGLLVPAGKRLRQISAAPLRPAEPMPSPIVTAITWAMARATVASACPPPPAAGPIE